MLYITVCSHVQLYRQCWTKVLCPSKHNTGLYLQHAHEIELYWFPEAVYSIYTLVSFLDNHQFHKMADSALVVWSRLTMPQTFNQEWIDVLSSQNKSKAECPVETAAFHSEWDILFTPYKPYLPYTSQSAVKYFTRRFLTDHSAFFHLNSFTIVSEFINEGSSITTVF